MANMTFKANLLPNTNLGFELGSSSLKWKINGVANPNLSDTTYTFANGSNGSFSVTPLGGSAQTVSIGKPATAGTADVANSVAWGNVSGKPSTFAPSAHTHLVTEITQGNAAVVGSLDPLTQSLIGSASSNKSFGLPAAAIKIEYSTNGGSTWTDYGATDAQKKALFCETRNFNAVLGKATTAAANSTNNQLRITIEPTDRYVSFNGLYIWMSTSGNTVTVDLERSTIGAKDTFTSVFSGQSIAGWSGNNIRYFSYGSFGGGTNQTSNNYKYRLTFKQTAINSNYGSASINDIRFLGLNVWRSPNNMVSKNHLYTWNENLDATFPAQITATAFNGNASSATKLQTTRSITIGNKSNNFDGSANISYALQDILIRSGNEFNYTADGISGLWFNYKTQSGTTATTKISSYTFGNGQGSSSGVSIVADNFSGNASSATKATQDESGNNIKATYASSFSISDHTITLKNKNGTSLGTVTVPDNNTTYTAGTGLSLSGTTFNHSNSITAKTAAAQSAKTLTWGGTFTIYEEKYDAQGHITGVASYNMTMPANPNSDTKNTAGSTDTSSKIFLIGATTQAANPQTYSDNQVYATNGQLDANVVRVAEHVKLQYNTTTNALDFVFA